MNAGAIVWMIVFALAALLYTTVAIYVSIRGYSDLKDLLKNRSGKDGVSGGPN